MFGQKRWNLGCFFTGRLNRHVSGAGEIKIAKFGKEFHVADFTIRIEDF